MADYVPIACIEHERLEFAVLKRQRLHLRYRDESGMEHAADLLPVDVYTRAGEEWLKVQDLAGSESTIRLDRILASRPV